MGETQRSSEFRTFSFVFFVQLLLNLSIPSSIANLREFSDHRLF